MSPILALVLAVAPVVSVTSSDVRVDGRVTISPLPDDAYLNLPPLEEALRRLRPDGGVLECPIESAPEVPFKVLKRVIFSCASAGVRVPTFRVGAVGPFRVGSPPDDAADGGPGASEVVLAIAPATLTFRATAGAPEVLGDVDGGVPPPEVLKTRLGARASTTWLLAVVNDEVRADRLAAVVAACRAAGVPDVRLVPEAVPGASTSVGLGGRAPGPQLGSLDKELIRKVIHANRGMIRECYDTALARKPGLQGKVAVKFVISPGGPVASATVAEDTTGDAALGECISAAVQRWVFPKPKGDGMVLVTYPFIFKQTGQ